MEDYKKYNMFEFKNPLLPIFKVKISKYTYLFLGKFDTFWGIRYLGEGIFCPKFSGDLILKSRQFRRFFQFGLATLINDIPNVILKREQYDPGQN
jgi:hypothetical protein